MSARVKCCIVKETEKALRIEQNQPNRESVKAWIPRSLCSHISKGPMQEDGTRDATITMASWVAEQHNLKEEA